jgi:hypothetical protein
MQAADFSRGCPDAIINLDDSSAALAIRLPSNKIEVAVAVVAVVAVKFAHPSWAGQAF